MWLSLASLNSSKPISLDLVVVRMSGNWCPDRDLHWNCQGHCQIHQIDRNCLPNFEWCLHHLLAKLKRSKHAEGNQSYRKVSMWASHLCLLGNTDKVPSNSQNMSCTCMRPVFILLLVTMQCAVYQVSFKQNKCALWNTFVSVLPFSAFFI